MKTVLCFGDSNTWGYSPDGGQRYGDNVRWPSRLQGLLGGAYQIIEAGQPGRTSNFNLPQHYLRACGSALAEQVKQHGADVVILMLGTNDLHPEFSQNAKQIAQNVAELATKAVDLTQIRLILLAPPPILATGHFAQLFAGGAEKSQHFAQAFGAQAARLNCAFFDAGTVVSSCPSDGVHWQASAHSALAEALAQQFFADVV